MIVNESAGAVPSNPGRAGKDPMNDTSAGFEMLATTIVAREDAHLCNDGSEVQTKRAVEQLERFNAHTPLRPVHDTAIDLAGFGRATVYFASADEQYLLLSEVAEALGVPVWTACEWARREQLLAVEDQREQDEQRGDGRLGWDLLRDYCDMHLDFVIDNPEATPDGGGRRWSSYGDWLISTDRIPLFILDSPWGEEFRRNMRGLFAHAFLKSGMADLVGDAPTYTTGQDADGNPVGSPTGWTLVDHMRERAELIPEDDAIRRARRGPALEGEDL